MELFSKIYNCYYQVVNHILLQASAHPITQKEIAQLIQTYAFRESTLTILPCLLTGKWDILKKEGKESYSSKLKHCVKLPLTGLQKSWLKALLSDIKIRLFFDQEQIQYFMDALKDTEPLYLQEDFHYFDRCADRDPYENSSYQKNFRLIMNAVEEEKVLKITYEKESLSVFDFFPLRLEYSSKDDKFRVCGARVQNGHVMEAITLNLGRIKECALSNIQKEKVTINKGKITKKERNPTPVVIEISGERNSLERCMLHFSNYEKITEYEEEKNVYLCSIFYDKQDESELLIQILSFGPVIKVLGPENFLKQIRQRVKKQHELLEEYL